LVVLKCNLNYENLEVKSSSVKQTKYKYILHRVSIIPAKDLTAKFDRASAGKTDNYLRDHGIHLNTVGKQNFVQIL